MTMFKMPMLPGHRANVLIIASFPILTVANALLTLDRYLGTIFLYQRYGWQHDDVYQLVGPGAAEVYILILPVFGVFSKLRQLSRVMKRLFGYTSLVWATVTLITRAVTFIVWLHHFFTMGAGAGNKRLLLVLSPP